MKRAKKEIIYLRLTEDDRARYEREWRLYEKRSGMQITFSDFLRYLLRAGGKK